MPSSDFWKGKRILLTGHTGFKGAWLASWLERLGAQVFGLSLAPDQSDNLFDECALASRIDSVFGDIRDLDTVVTAMERAKPGIVFHLAAQSLVRQSYHDPIGTYATNVMGTVHVLEAARRVGSVRVVVNVTSDKCYENQEWAWPYRENEPMGGADPYSSSKGCSELITSAWRRSFFDKPLPDGRTVALASVRAGNVVGGGDWACDRLIPDCIRAISRGRPAIIRNPHAIRPWQHVLEPLSGYLLLAEGLWREGAVVAEAWNFGPLDGAAPRPVSWVVSRVVELWGDGASWQLDGNEHPHEASYLRVDSSKTQARLGWQSRLDIEDTLCWTVEWYRRRLNGEAADRLVLEQINRYENFGADPK